VKKKIIIISAAAVLAILALGAGGYLLATKTAFGKRVVGVFRNVEIGPVAAKGTIEDFVKKNLVPPGTEITTSDATEEGGLYKAVVTVQGQDHPVYLTLDGKKLFPSALDTEVKKPETAAAERQPAKEIPKSAKPEVKLFVMSYCPYGTQAEKGILPVLSKLGNKIDFTLEFVSYAMHDKKELDENLRQYCIRKQEPEKLSAYLGCFLKKGQGTETACLSAAKVDASKNVACTKAADTEFNVTKNFNDKGTYQGNFPTFLVDKEDNDQYSIQGSPTLVINGVTADAAQRDPASLLGTICSSFENAPAECGATLASAAPAPGFGDGTASAPSSGAACGN